MRFFEMRGRLVLVLFTFVLSICSVKSACVPPREGTWIIKFFEPQIQFREPAIGYLFLRKDPDLPNIYTGPSTIFNVAYGPRLVFYFFLHAVFDEEECRMYGTNVSPAISVRDEINWIVEGAEKINGLFIGKSGVLFPFPYTSMQTVEFSSENMDVSMESLLANAGYSYPNTTSHHSF